MPSAIKYIPPTEAERVDFSGIAQKELQRRKDNYKTALKYYLGDQDEQLEIGTDEEGNPLPDDNTHINMVQLTGDRTIQFLFSDMPEFETNPDSLDPTPEEIFLDEFFEANGGLHTLTKLGLRGFLSGHSFVRVKPPASADSYPTMIVLDPTTVSVFWKADDVGDVLWYEQRYVVGGSVYIRDYVKSDDGQSWTVYTYVNKQTQQNPMEQYPTPNGTTYLDFDITELQTGNFVLDGKPERHMSAIAPIIEFPHLAHPDDYYGLSEFTQKDLQDTINRINSERNRIVRETSDPIDYITGADIDDVQDDGGIVAIPNAAARVNRLEMKSDLSGITSVLDKLIETYLAIARVVLLKGEAKDLQRVTNASVRTLFLDALAKNAILQSSYGKGLKAVCKLALLMGYANNMIDANPIKAKVDIHFGSPLPTDMMEVATINQIAANYMSNYSAQIRLQLDPKVEDAHKKTEMEQNLANQDAQMALAAKHAIAPPAGGGKPQPQGKPTDKPQTGA